MTALLQNLASVPRRVIGFDRVGLALLLIFGLLLALQPAQAQASLDFTLQSLWGVAPLLLLSVALAAYAKASGAENLIARAFQGRTALMVLLAALVGALSPFCSCGVIPLIAALLAMGVPLAAVMAFWLASPIMDPSMFVLTAGTLGIDFAVAKTLAAVGLGLLGGYSVLALQRFGYFANPLRASVGNGGCAGGKVRSPKPVVWTFWRARARVTAFSDSAQSNLLFLGKWLALAFVLESLMLAYIPSDIVAEFAGDGSLAVLGATVVGIPAYLNGYAALPLVQGLIEQGMNPGAGMAFLVAGGVTSIPAAIAVWALARPSVFFAYLSISVIGAMTAGLVWNLFA
jgi:hypothetical protein